MVPFRLEQVLHYRQHLEDLALMDLTQAQEHLQEEIVQLRLLETRHEQVSEHLRADSEHTASLRGLYQDYLYRLQEEMALQRDRICHQESVVEEKRQQVVDAMKQRKVIETLKRHYTERHRRQSERQDQQLTDDAGIAAYIRNH